jgi:hypothetical protein
MKSKPIVWACRCSRCIPFAERTGGTEFASQYHHLDGRPTSRQDGLEATGARLSTIKAAPKTLVVNGVGTSFRLESALATIAAARSRCIVGVQSVGDEVITLQIQARVQLLESIGRLRELMMHERFGRPELGRLRERRRRDGSRLPRN